MGLGIKKQFNLEHFRRPGVKPHRSVAEAKHRNQAYYRRRANNIKRLYDEIVRDFRSYNRNERPVIKHLDQNNQSYMNSAAGPIIIDTLEHINRTKIGIAKLHKLLAVDGF